MIRRLALMVLRVMLQRAAVHYHSPPVAGNASRAGSGSASHRFSVFQHDTRQVLVHERARLQPGCMPRAMNPPRYADVRSTRTSERALDGGEDPRMYAAASATSRCGSVDLVHLTYQTAFVQTRRQAGMPRDIYRPRRPHHRRESERRGNPGCCRPSATRGDPPPRAARRPPPHGNRRASAEPPVHHRLRQAMPPVDLPLSILRLKSRTNPRASRGCSFLARRKFRA